MILTDTHCHLTLPEFDSDREEVIQRARDAGVGRMVVLGIDADSSEQAIRLAGQHEGMWAAIGLHPHEAIRLTGEEKQKLQKMAGEPVVVAIGETGLDYHWDRSPRPAQMAAFRWQLDLAARFDLPIIIHSRDAMDDTLAVLWEHSSGGKLRGVMHCFSGGLDTMEKVVELGMHISLAGPVTYPTAHAAVNIAKEAPLDRLLIETDCPYLAPQPHRGKRNEPAYLSHTANRVAEARGASLDEIATATSANAASLFGFPVALPSNKPASGGGGE